MARGKQTEGDATPGATAEGDDGTGGFRPYADDNAALTVGGFTVENGTVRVALSGSVDLTLDKEGLAKARALKVALDAIVDTLQSKGDLPEKASESEAPVKRVRNPFG